MAPAWKNRPLFTTQPPGSSGACARRSSGWRRARLLLCRASGTIPYEREWEHRKHCVRSSSPPQPASTASTLSWAKGLTFYVSVCTLPKASPPSECYSDLYVLFQRFAGEVQVLSDFRVRQERALPVDILTSEISQEPYRGESSPTSCPTCSTTVVGLVIDE